MGACVTGASSTRRDMDCQMIEYMVLEAEAPANSDDLQSLVDKGWELVTVTPHGGHLYYYFKKFVIAFTGRD